MINHVYGRSKVSALLLSMDKNKIVGYYLNCIKVGNA